jgi:biopolymer transport protein ExbD
MQMTPMIDMVFQLLIYFLFTFRITTTEADFNLKLPVAVDDAESPGLVAPLEVALRSDESGNLRELVVSTSNSARILPVVPGNRESARAAFATLLSEVKQYVGRETGPGSLRSQVEARISFDYNLHYRYVIDAMTNVTGYRDSQGQVVRLIEKVNFARAKQP